MRLAVYTLLALALGTPTAGAAKPTASTLLQVATPPARGTVPAHPFVNAIVRFGTLDDGTPTDPSTFHARLGALDVTDRFVAMRDGEAVVGVRATFDASMLHVDRGRNRLRVSVQSARSSAGRRVRDKRRLRFRATAAENACPMPSAAADTVVVVPGKPIAFNATATIDPEDDALTWTWNFGDGATATGATATHAYAGPAVDRTVALVVRDGGCEARTTLDLLGAPKPPPGRVRGLLGLGANGPLELGPTALSTSSTRTFTVRNDDPNPASWISGHLVVDGAAFTVEPATVGLASGASTPVTVRFTPTSPGHQQAVITLAASATNHASVRLLAHGYGGAAAGSGPTLALRPLVGEPVDAFGEIATVLPQGARVGVDTMVGVCSGNGSACLGTDDCPGPGARCDMGFGFPFPPTDLCGDGQGGVYLLSDIAFAEPDPNRYDNLRTAGIMRIDLDGAGGRTGARLFRGLNEDTASLACDGFPTESGRAYVAERFAIDSPGCDRSERDALTRVRKKNGDQSIVQDRLDEALGFHPCEEGDAVMERGLRIRPDAEAVYAAFDVTGIWRTMPTPLHYTPDLPDAWDMHPDGSLVAVLPAIDGVAIYRLTPEQVAANPLPLNAVGPCAVIPLPSAPRPLGVYDSAIGDAVDTMRGTLLVVSVITGGSDAAIPAVLLPRGLVAAYLPHGTAACDVAGVISLDPMSQMSF